LNWAPNSVWVRVFPSLIHNVSLSLSLSFFFHQLLTPKRTLSLRMFISWMKRVHRKKIRRKKNKKRKRKTKICSTNELRVSSDA
jgi:hypothetical protein